MRGGRTLSSLLKADFGGLICVPFSSAWCAADHRERKIKVQVLVVGLDGSMEMPQRIHWGSRKTLQGSDTKCSSLFLQQKTNWRKKVKRQLNTPEHSHGVSL